MGKRPVALIGALVLSGGWSVATTGQPAPRVEPVASHARTREATPATRPSPARAPMSDADAQALLDRTCVGCHNARSLRGNLSLESFDVTAPTAHAAIAEKVIRKLRAGQMPPPGMRRPDEASLTGLAELLETRIDAHAVASPNPGRRTFQRLNRAEYERSIRDLLALDVKAGDYLPLDAKSANFDNVADAQLLSPTLMNGYLTAAAEISRLAVGDPAATAREVTYQVSRWTSQREQVDGAPYGTRGGVVATHTFPADGRYRFRVSFFYETTGALYGNGRAALHTAEAPEQVEISIDGERVALLDIDRWMHASDPDGLNLTTEPIAITAGPHRVAAAFIRRLEGPVQDLISPHDWSIASTSIADAYGFTTLPHLRDLAITGPFDPSGVSETPSRRAIFTCRPATPREELSCARDIVSRLGARAYRRPLTRENLDALMSLYEAGSVEGGFEAGVRIAIEGLLASPHFVFRFEAPPSSARGDESYALGDLDLASRLSFFLWATGPDEALLEAATRGTLLRPAELERQVRRMLADPRADALSTRFGAQWLRLQDIEPINPDVRTYPDYSEQLKQSMLRETELFFRHLVRADRSMLELLTADYTFVDERLAAHYRLQGVVGSEFRKVTYPDTRRRGVLAHGSILTLTSHADRTSPVLRGKWVMEVLLGTPPPPPPPDVPDLEATAEAGDGRLRSVRERLEEHRANAACSSCHRMIDPIGLALENFDVTGAWRIRDNDVPVDAAGELYDGTKIGGPDDLRQALLRRPEPLVRTFTENLMTYALGRRLEHFDMPAVRAIAREAAAADYRMSAFILGVVRTPAFRMKAADEVAATTVGAPAARH
jgi:hypothetical protein